MHKYSVSLIGWIFGNIFLLNRTFLSGNNKFPQKTNLMHKYGNYQSNCVLNYIIQLFSLVRLSKKHKLVRFQNRVNLA